ncbi:Pol, partial [Symbiodinium necroappetens]
RRTRGELEARAKKKARREQEAAAAAAAPLAEAEPGPVWQDRRGSGRPPNGELQALTTVPDREIAHVLLIVWRSAPTGFFVFRRRADAPLAAQGARSAEILHAIQQDAKKRYTLRHFDGEKKLRRRELPPYLYHGTRVGALSIIATMECISRKECAEPLQARPPQGKPLQRDSAGHVKRVVDTCVQRLLLFSASGGDAHAYFTKDYCRMAAGLAGGTLTPHLIQHRTTAPLGAVSSHMSYTPNSEASLLWSPGDESGEFPPSPAPAAPTASAVPARETPGQAAESSFRFRLAPLFISCTRFYIAPIRGDNGDSPAEHASDGRMQHPPPSIAAGPKPGGNGQRTWMPALKMKAPPPNLLPTGSTEAEPRASPPAPPPKRSAEAATLATDETGGQEKLVTEQALIPTAPAGEPSRQATSLLPPEPPVPRRNVMRAWIGDLPAPTILAITQKPAMGAEQSALPTSLDVVFGVALNAQAFGHRTLVRCAPIPVGCLIQTGTSTRTGLATEAAVVHPWPMQTQLAFPAKELSVGPLAELPETRLSPLTTKAASVHLILLGEYPQVQVRSQIDFFFARAAQIDGARHYPVLVSIPAVHYQSPAKILDAFCDHLAHTLSASPDPSELVLRPFTIVAQIRHWRGTGERLWFSVGCRVLMRRYPFCPRAKPLRLIWHSFTCGTLVKMFSSRILPLSANNSGSPLMTSINSGQTPGSHGSLSLAKPRTSQRGRIVVKALTLQLRPSLTEATRSWPQYAYVPGRSIEHAIIRALHHCRRVQTAIASQRITLQERRATGRVPTACQGGVTLSIDTSKAFDTVDRSVLEQELKTARISEPELTLIMSLHQNIGYWPAGPESDIRVSSERGVRQGCPLAPSLWTLVTVALLRTMAGTASLDWIQHDTTMFADDLLLQWEYNSISELECMISTIQHCFQVLARLGLQVQHRKTQLLVAQKGRLAHKWWQAHTASTKDGRFLRIPQPGQKDLHLPIVPQLTYLGIVLSYKDATTATVEHRLQVAEAQRARLLKVLHSRTLPLQKRVQLWVACVRSSALYGLHLLDLQQKHVARITVVLVKHLKAIARSFAHMSQEASQTLLLRLGVEDPLHFLLRTGQKLLTKTLQSQDPMVHQPRILQWLAHITEARLALDSHVAHVIPPIAESCPAATALDGDVKESLRIVPRAAADPLADDPPATAPAPGVQTTLRQFCATCGQWLVPLLMTVKKWVTLSHHVSTVEHMSPVRISTLVRALCSGKRVFVVWYRQTLHPKASPSRHLPPTQPHPAMEHVPMQMDLDEEEKECFGNLLGKRALALGVESPSKYPHPGGKGAPPQGGSRPRPPPPHRGSRQAAPSQGSRTKEEHRGKSGTSSDQLLHKVAKALIVQSDYLSRLQSDHTVIFTFRNGDGPQLMVPLLHEVAANWRDQRSKGKVTKSLKQTLLQYVTAEIITRVTTFADDPSAQAKAQEMGWVTSDLEYNYLDWNAEERKLVPRQEATLTQDQILADARRLKTLLKEQELIIKFS